MSLYVSRTVCSWSFKGVCVCRLHSSRPAEYRAESSVWGQTGRESRRSDPAKQRRRPKTSNFPLNVLIHPKSLGCFTDVWLVPLFKTQRSNRSHAEQRSSPSAPPKTWDQKCLDGGSVTTHKLPDVFSSIIPHLVLNTSSRWHVLLCPVFSLFESDFFSPEPSKGPTHLLSLSSCCPLRHESCSPSTVLFHLSKLWI